MKAGRVEATALLAATLGGLAPGDAALAQPSGVQAPAATTPAATSAATPSAAAAPPAPVVVRYATHRPPGFLVMHGSGGVLDPIGAYGSVGGGDALLKANDIPDPAVEMAQIVADQFALRRHAMAADAPLLADQKEAEAIFYQATDGQAAPQGYIVDVATLSWAALYYAGDPRHSYLDYRARLQIIDLAAGTVVLQANCEHHGDKATDAFAWDEADGDGPHGLKARIHAVVDECLAQFRASGNL